MVRYTLAAAILFIPIAVLTIVIQINELMGSRGLPALADASMYLQVTTLGRSWSWRLALTTVTMLLVAVLPPDRRSTWWSALTVATAALVPLAAVSHAAGATEYTTLFITLDWVHLMSISIWFGGLVAMSLDRSSGDADSSRGSLGFSATLSRFSQWAVVCLPVAVATGAFQMQNTLNEANDLVAFAYGKALLAKHLFLLPVLALAGHTMLVIKPRLAVYGTQELVRRAKQNIRAEALLVVGMLASTAYLTNEVPPSHIGVAGPQHLLAFKLSLDPLLLLWGILAVGAAYLLLRAASQATSWVRSTGAAALLVGAAFMGVTGQVATLDQEVFHHSTDPDVVARGRALFAQNCAVCHGVSGKGNGPLAAGLTPPPADLTQLHFYHHSDETVLQWVSDGIPESAMPGFKEKLTLEERKAVVSFIRQLGLDAAQNNQ